MRLFTGLSIEPGVVEKLASALERLWPSAKLKWSPVANLHITSKFIGEWPEGNLDGLQDALAGVDPTGPIHVGISGFGFFPNPHRPRVFFAGVQAPPEAHELARRIDEMLAGIGVKKEERPYLPHLTLARIKNESVQGLREQIASMTDFDFGRFAATEFHLYLSKGGAYQILRSYPVTRSA